MKEQILIRITGRDQTGLTASVMQILARYDAQILDTEYAADILLHLILPKQNEQAFLDRVVDVTAGRVRGVVVGEEYRAFPKKT